MQNGISLNLGWKFKPDFQKDYLDLSNYDDFTSINIPHTVCELPYDCFDQTMTCIYSTYMRYIELQELESKRILLQFEGVSAYYDLYINGCYIGNHKGAYSTELFDVTDYVHPGQNKLLLMVDSHERNDIPPNGSTVDYLIYGGIYRDVTLFIQEKAYIKHVLFRYTLNGNVPKVYPEIFFDNCAESFSGFVNIALTHNGDTFYEYSSPVRIFTGTGSVTLDEQTLPSVLLWSPEHPDLYDVKITLTDGTSLVDSSFLRIGFRTLSADTSGIYLNGQKIKLLGINRHQSYPYVGYAMGKRAQEKDAEIIKKELGINAVRCSHYMQSKYFLDKCDELGLLVFEEIPGWGYIGDESFQKVVMNDLDNMVIGHFNHPSIIIWGTRLNESTDCDELYSRTNRRCKELDPQRLTSGARWHAGSPLFEDIYSYNDYSPEQNGEFILAAPLEITQTDHPVPYLISEHSGALMPTKPDDSEERLEKFALFHAKVASKVSTDNRYLGAFGWCLFDYNTHNDHNSMEKICFHGIMDMFRVPKWASYFYKSQKVPSEEIVLQPCSMVGRGERIEPVPFWVFTNCDYIDVTLSADITRRYYPSSKFSGLLHPPIEVTENGEFWQRRWRGAKITGYINNKKVKECVYSDNPHLDDMTVTADDTVLFCDRVDETRVVCTFVDENGNRLLYHKDIISIQVSGDIELIGPDIIPSTGGAAAFWVKTKANSIPGTASIMIKTFRKELKEKNVSLNLILPGSTLKD